jgi:hypothetical protein
MIELIIFLSIGALAVMYILIYQVYILVKVFSKKKNI